MANVSFWLYSSFSVSRPLPIGQQRNCLAPKFRAKKNSGSDFFAQPLSRSVCWPIKLKKHQLHQKLSSHWVSNYMVQFLTKMLIMMVTLWYIRFRTLLNLKCQLNPIPKDKITLQPRSRTSKDIELQQFLVKGTNDNGLTRDSIMIELVTTFDEAASTFLKNGQRL